MTTETQILFNERESERWFRYFQKNPNIRKLCKDVRWNPSSPIKPSSHIQVILALGLLNEDLTKRGMSIQDMDDVSQIVIKKLN